MFSCFGSSECTRAPPCCFQVLDESDSSSELSCHRRARVGRADVAPTAKLPRPLPHLPTPPTPPKVSLPGSCLLRELLVFLAEYRRPATDSARPVTHSLCRQAWEDSDLEREQRDQKDQQRDREWDRDRDRVLQMPAPTRWEFPRDKLRLQTLLGQGNFGQVRASPPGGRDATSSVAVRRAGAVAAADILKAFIRASPQGQTKSCTARRNEGMQHFSAGISSIMCESRTFQEISFNRRPVSDRAFPPLTCPCPQQEVSVCV